MADVGIDSAAKRLAASYMKVHSDHDSMSELKQRAKIQEEIQWKRAFKKELQQFLSGLQILKYGMQGGHGSRGPLEGAISRQTHDAVLTLMEKYPVALGPKKPPPPPPPASNDQDFPQQDMSVGLLKARMQEVIRYQEQQLDALKRSHKFQQLQHAKEEAAKARQSLEATESALQEEVKKSDHYAEQIRQEFTSLAIQVGEEQERCEQVNAQLDAIVKNRDALLRPTEFGIVESMDGLEDKGAGQPTNQLQLSDLDENFAGVGLSFLKLNEFNLGFTFKNPNSFSEILNVIDSLQGYEKIGKDIQPTPHKEAESLGEGKNNHNLWPRKASVMLKEYAEKAESAYFSHSSKRQKMVENVQLPRQKSTDDQLVAQHDNSLRTVAENSSKLNNQEKSVPATAESTVKSIEGHEREAQIKKAPSKRAASSKGSTKQLPVAQNDRQGGPPSKTSENPKPQAATTSSAAANAAKECTTETVDLKTPASNVLATKPLGKQPEPQKALQAVVSMSHQISPKNLRNVPSRQSKTSLSKRNFKNSRKKQAAANAVASMNEDNSGMSDAMEQDSSLELMLEATATNQGSLELRSPSRFFDINLSNDSLKISSDIDMTDLDFLKDDDAATMLLEEPASKKAKSSKKKELESFDFNFYDQDDGENPDSTEGEFF